MQTFSQQIAALQGEGYALAEAQAKVAHDAILYAIGKSGFKPNSTIKGGVVMCELTREIRRTTMDLDIDFIHYPITKTAITRIVARWARHSGYRISISGEIQELRQQDYRGKRIHLDISDGSTRSPLRTKIDIGVHSHDEIVQEERAFAILAQEPDRTLYANTLEQVFTEKLLSLLRHDILSTRTKDVFDMYYLSMRINRSRLKKMLGVLVLGNSRSPMRSPGEILTALGRIFKSKRFVRDMSRWLSTMLAIWIISRIFEGILGYWEFGHVNSGSAEGFNTKIRLLMKQSYGLRDFKYLKLKIMDLPSRKIRVSI